MIVFWNLNWSTSVSVVHLWRLDYLVNLHCCDEGIIYIGLKTFSKCMWAKKDKFKGHASHHLVVVNDHLQLQESLWTPRECNFPWAAVEPPPWLFFFLFCHFFIWVKQLPWNWEFSFYVFCIVIIIECFWTPRLSERALEQPYHLVLCWSQHFVPLT